MASILLLIHTIALLAGSGGQANGENPYKDIDWNQRNKVFYTLWDKEDDQGYHISKTRRMFIIDNQIFLREFPGSETRMYKIREIDYQGDSLIVASVDYDYMASAPYAEILAGEQQPDWKEMYNLGASLRKVTLIKNPSTQIWTIHIEGFFDHTQWIDTYDIIPSGYNYQNQHTTPHDPKQETFLPVKSPVFSAVYNLEEEPVKLLPGTEEYYTMERPYEGVWLEITNTDIGDVVYDYPEWYRGNSYDHLTIQVDHTVFTVTHHNLAGHTDSSILDKVLFYPEDGSYRFYPWAGMYYSFKWIDKEKHICQWTLFHTDWNTGYTGIRSQKNYIHKDHNIFPVITYDWE